MPIVTYCCCGCSLRTGTLIFLWIGIVILGLIDFRSLSDFIVKGEKNHLMSILVFILFVIYMQGIHGAKNKKPGYLIPFLVFLVIVMVLIILVMLGLAIDDAVLLPIVLAFLKIETYEERIAILIIQDEICLLFGLALTIYIFIIVLSLYQEMKSEAEETTEDLSVSSSV